YFQRRIHRRYLVILSEEAEDTCFYFLFFQPLCAAFREHYAGGVLCICGPSEQQNRLISLIPVREHITDPGGSAQTNGKHALRIRIQRARVSDLLLSRDPPQTCHHVMGSISFFFINIQYPVDHSSTCAPAVSSAPSPLSFSALSSWRRICPVILLITSWLDPFIVTPAALTCPPPPK